MRHIILNMEAPLIAFGGAAVDNYRVIRWFPAISMLTGLMANAMGWVRADGDIHQQLQDRTVYAARIGREPPGGMRMTDYQTAMIYQDDVGWTTLGYPSRRETSPSYRPVAGSDRKALTQQIYQDYFPDMRVTVALRMDPADAEPQLDDVAERLCKPARPLFIGRKTCLPSVPMFGGFAEGATAMDALLNTPLDDDRDTSDELRVFWSAGEGVASIDPSHRYMLTDQRDWRSGLHGGARQVYEGIAGRDAFAVPATA